MYVLILNSEISIRKNERPKNRDEKRSKLSLGLSMLMDIHNLPRSKCGKEFYCN